MIPKRRGRSSWLPDVVVATSAGLCMLLGLGVLAGWHTGNLTLVRILPTFVPMPYNAALCFLLCGAALLSDALSRPRWSVPLAGGALVVAGATLSQYLTGTSLGIDQLLMAHYLPSGTSFPGRMTFNTALCVSLASVALFFNGFPTRMRQRPALTGYLGGAVALGGYLTGVEAAYGWVALDRTSVHTAAGLVVLGFGVLVLAWRDIRRQGAGISGWVFSLFVTGAMGSVLVWQVLFVPEVSLVVGLLMASLLASTVYLGQTAWQRAKEVERTNRDLEDEIVERMRAETELKAHREHLEDLVEERTVEIRQANLRLESEVVGRKKAQQMFERWVATMSHEMRTPLSAVNNYAELLGEQIYGPLNEKQTKAVRGIDECSQLLLSVVNSILDLSKIEAGQVSVAYKDFDVAQLCEEVLETTRSAAAAGKKRGIEITGKVEPSLRRMVTDPAKLKQILLNLLGNAVKFTRQGEVCLSASTGEGESVRFAISDTGIGIPQNKQKIIFKPFHQERSATREYGGAGLGLHISNRLAGLLGGNIGVESAEGKGSVFTLTLPLSPPPDDRLPFQHVSARQEGQGPGSETAGDDGTSGSEPRR